MEANQEEKMNKTKGAKDGRRKEEAVKGRATKLPERS